uniref:Uncharacterized protein n=1 Tax=Rhizophora mucronata TaxID=61149 RepID=A0A2P2R3F4_RHIMU
MLFPGKMFYVSEEKF